MALGRGDAQQPWWEARITGAFMAYWVYQHLGNLSPPELDAETTLRACRRTTTRGRSCASSRTTWDRESAASRWAFYRDFGDTRLLVLDSRAARVLSDERRQMIDDEEWDWIVEHSRGAFDHVIVASTLPVFMPIGIHHLQAWNEALCAGRWGRRRARPRASACGAPSISSIGRAFNRSFEQLCDWLRAVARGTDASPRRPRDLLLGGDVHSRSVSEVDLGGEQAPRPPARLLAVPQPALVERALGRPCDRLSCKRPRLCEARGLGGRRSPQRDVGALAEGDVRERDLGARDSTGRVPRSSCDAAPARGRIRSASSRSRPVAGGQRMTTSRVAAKARETLVSGERLLGEAISDQICRHHRRRLRRQGWEHALDHGGGLGRRRPACRGRATRSRS